MKLMKYILVTACALAAVTPSVCSAARPKPKVTRAAEDSTITQAIDALNQYATLQKKIGIQNADLAYAMRKALVLADVLIGQDGTLNLTSIQAAKAAFVPDHPLKYEVTIGHVLDQLDASWQPFLDSVVAPSKSAVAANTVLRGLFGLNAKDVVTDRHAKVAVLSALFAPYNQGPVGDCFAVAGLERDHEKFFKHAANDYAQIVQHGFVTSTVGVVQDNFFFVNVLADSDISNVFYLNASGMIVASNTPLLSVPGFAAASNAMGGDRNSQLLQDTLKVLFKGKVQGVVKVSPEIVIAAMAQALAASVPNTDPDVLLSQGLYSFSSLTNNPIQRSSECVFAAMAEDRVQDYVRGNINSAIQKSMNLAFELVALNPKASAFKKAFYDKLNASFRLIYNPSIPLQQVASDGSSSQGGFQLYKRVFNDPTQIGTHVATPEDLRQLVLSSISQTEVSLGVSTNVHLISLALSKCVSGDSFLENVLWNYDSANRAEPDPVKNYQSLARTPMQSCDGDNPYEVNYIDTGINESSRIVGYSPKDTTDLLTWCLALAKKSPAELCPMTSPEHAFNFDPTNPDIVAFLQSGRASDYWIRQMVIVPSLQVATRQIDANTKTVLANAMYSVLSEVLPDETQYQALVDKLGALPLTIQRYSQRLLSGIEQLVQLNAAQTAQLELILDAQLIQALSSGDRAILENASLKFAFTNWNDGTKDIYFCAYFNPRTLQLSFALIDEDKTGLYPMNETEWVNNQQWTVDITGSDPSNVLMAVTP